MTAGWLIQSIGAIAMVLELLSIQCPKRKHILLMQLSASSLWVVHYVFLGALTGALMSSVSAVRTYAFYKMPIKRRPRWSLWFFLVLTIVVGAFSWQGYISLLPVAGILIAVIAMWQTKERHIRLILLAASPLWLTYNLLVGSYVGVINEVLLIASLIIALWRYRKKSIRGVRLLVD